MSIDRSSAPPPNVGVEPYIGLRPYTEADSAFFFGRHRDAGLLRNKILAVPLTILVAPSGVGKTSILRALVIPALRRLEAHVIYFDDWIPPPIQALRKKLAASLDVGGSGEEQRSLLDLTREANQRGKKVVCIVDQGEQLFLRHAKETDAFGEEIGALLRSDANVHLVFSLREEYLAGLEALRSHLLTVNQATHRLVRLTGDAAREAIREPARTEPFQGSVEDPLVETLLKDLEASGESAGVAETTAGSAGIDLPFLQIICTHLWKAEGTGPSRQLTMALYEELGKRRGIVDGYVQKVMANLTTEQRLDTAMILDLLAPIAGVKMAYPVQALEKHADIGHERLHAVLSHLSDQMLVRKRDNGKVVELYHDAFAQVLRPWIDQVIQTDRLARELAKQKQERGAQRNRVFVIITAIASVGAAIAFLLYNFLFVWERASYYRSYVSVYGAPRGIGELTHEQVRHRPLSFRIVTAGRIGRALRLYTVNSLDDQQGDPGPDELVETEPLYLGNARARRQPSIWRYDYNRDGTITSEYAYTKRNEPAHGIVYAPEEKKSGEKRTRLAYFTNSEGTPGPVKSDPNESAFFWAKSVRYSDEGFEEHARYLGISGEPIPGADRAFATKSEHDAQGRLIATTSLDAKDAPMNDAFGNASLHIEYDEHDNPIQKVARDAQGQPTKTKEGWAIRRSVFDTFGNTTELAYFDEKDQPVDVDTGWHKATSTLDGHGNVLEQRDFDREGKPAADRGYACHGYKYQRDAKGRIIQWTCLGADGSPARSSRGHVYFALRYDERDLVVEERYLDTEGNPTWTRNGYASRLFKRDAHGRITEVEHRGVDDQLVTNSDGIAISTTTYDDLKRSEKFFFLGINRKPVLVDEGHSSAERALDIWGNLVEERFFDPSGNPKRTADGYAGARMTYGTRGQLMETIYLGEAGEIVFRKDGYAGWLAEFDDLGRRTTTRYVGLRKELIINPDSGVAGWTSTYDQWGHAVEIMYFGTDRKPVASFQGDAGFRAEYDAVGNQTELKYVDTQGALALHVWMESEKFAGSGYAKVKRAFDARGKLLEETYFGVHDERVVRPEGWSRALHSYDERGNRIQTSYFGAKDEPIKLGKSYGGYHAVLRIYGPLGNAIGIQYLDTDQKTLIENGEGHARVVRELDRLGKMAKESFFMADNTKATLKDGVHLIETTRDAYGRRTAIANFGPQDPPNKLNSLAYRYDDWGNLIETRTLDSEDKLVVRDTNSCAIQRWTWNERQEKSEEQCLDASEALYPGLHLQAARIEYGYGGRSQMTSIKYYDKNDRPFKTTDGYVGRRMKYDSLGHLIEDRYVDKDGHLTATRLNYPRTTFVRDQFERAVEEAYFDKDGKATTPVAKMETEYDTLGLRVLDRYLGPGDKLVSLAGSAQHETHYEYDSFGKLVALHYLDTNMKPTRGYARFYDSTRKLCGRWVAQYDADGNRTGNGLCAKDIPRK